MGQLANLITEPITEHPIDGHQPQRRYNPARLGGTHPTYRMLCNCGWEERSPDGRVRFHNILQDDHTCVSPRAIEAWFQHVLVAGPYDLVGGLFEQLRLEVAA